MSIDDDGPSWLTRIKQFLQGEPQNQDELLDLLRDAKLRSLIDEETLGILEGAMHFSRLKVRDIMLPKNQMTCLNNEDSFEEVVNTVTQSGHSRFPVFSANDEEILGILHAKDLLRFHNNSDNFDLRDISRKAMFVPESKRLDSLLSEFKSSRNHMAIVVDEYGAVSGFVTIEDVIEQIIGEIEDEFDIDEEAYLKKHGESQYVVKAQMPIDEFNEALSTDFNDDTYDTIGGIIMNRFGYLPQNGEVITIGGLQFKILNADSRRIKLLECLDQRSLHSSEMEA